MSNPSESLPENVTLTNEERNEILNKNATIKLSTVLQIAKCLEVTCSRGAFKANEMRVVGELYDNLSNGLNQAFESKLKEKASILSEKSNKNSLETISEN